MKRWTVVLLICWGTPLGNGAGRAEPAAGKAEQHRSWVEPMRAVHARFTGRPGTLACFGDSITVSLAFWAPLAGQPRDMPPEMVRAHDLVKQYLRPECWDKWRGPRFGNEGSTTIRWARDHIDAWLKDLNPEVAIILFGTNDLGQLSLEEYRQKTREVVDHCLRNGTVVILTTPHPAAADWSRPGNSPRRCGRWPGRRGCRWSITPRPSWSGGRRTGTARCRSSRGVPGTSTRCRR